MAVGVIQGNVKAMGVLQLSVTLASTPAAGAAAGTAATTVTVPGLRLGDFVSVSKPTHTTGLIIGSASVTADDTVVITTANVTTGGAIAPAAETYTFQWVRPEFIRGTVGPV